MPVMEKNYMFFFFFEQLFAQSIPLYLRLVPYIPLGKNMYISNLINGMHNKKHTADLCLQNIRNNLKKCTQAVSKDIWQNLFSYIQSVHTHIINFEKKLLCFSPL